MNVNRAFAVIVVCVFIAVANVPAVRAAAPSIHLDETLFVSAKAEVPRDHDADWLKDDLELKIAEFFNPQLIFDSDESARRPNEPVTLFQVRPIHCVGFGCDTPFRVLIRFAYLWQKDGGYGPSSYCGNAHHGDNVAVDLYVESNNGKDWTISEILNFHFVWPFNKPEGDRIRLHDVQWFMGSHVILYMAASKHHLYFDTSYDGDDSVESSWPWNCNDDVNGKGAKVLPSLISPYPDQRPSNVGEPGLEHYAHCLEYKDKTVKQGTMTTTHCVKWSSPPAAASFINDLAPYGFPVEAAWSDQQFCGGLECDSDEVTSVGEMWQRDPFVISSAWDSHEMTGGMRGRLIDTKGKPVRNATLYYREVLVGMFKGGSDGPWSKVPLDQNGNYDARLTFGYYMLRPVASDYRFTAVPKSIELKRGEYTTTDFTGVPEPPAQGPAMSAAGAAIGSTDPKMEIVRSYVLTTSTPMEMVVADPQASDKGKNAKDPFVKLPRESVLSFHVESILDQSGHPAQSLAEAVCSSSYVKLPDGTTTEPCHLGGPVAGATLEVRLAAGSGVVEPESTAPVQLTTNANGTAYLKLNSGVRAGMSALQVDVKSNPVNPWAVFRALRQPVEIQPAMHLDDSRTQPRIALIPLTGREQASIAMQFVAPNGNQSGSFKERGALYGDVNSDFVVDQKDLDVIHLASGQRAGQRGFRRKLDLNGDHVVDEKDEAVVKASLGRTLRRTRPPPIR